MSPIDPELIRAPQPWKTYSLLLWAMVLLQMPSYAAAQPAAGEEGPARAAMLGVSIAEPAPDRVEGDGPFAELVIHNVMLINGEGAPPRGPVNIYIEGDRIRSIGRAAQVEVAPGRKVIDATGHLHCPDSSTLTATSAPLDRG